MNFKAAVSVATVAIAAAMAACAGPPASKAPGPVGTRPAPSIAGVETAAPAAPPAPAASPLVPIQPLVVPYRIEIGSPDPAVADAAAVIPAILEDPRGWQRANIDFRLDPAAPFTIVVVEGEEAQQRCLPYDVGGQFSCQNGPVVVLNAIRWREGVAHWPGDLASYRTMLVNHEVGHLLGMHHIRCPGEGAVAPVMEQQSGTLRGCQANAWPTALEITLAATHQFVVAPLPMDVPFPP